MPTCLNCRLVRESVPAVWRYEYRRPHMPASWPLCDPCKRDQEYLEARQGWHAENRREWHVYTPVTEPTPEGA